MVSGCVVAGCRSGYTHRAGENAKKRSVFRFPVEVDLLSKWMHVVPLQRNWTQNKISAVCELHFEDKLIRRHDTFLINGVVVSLARGRPRLERGAIPSIFPPHPSPFPEDSSGHGCFFKIDELRMDSEMLLSTPTNHMRASLPSLERDGKNEREDVSSCDGSEAWSESNLLPSTEMSTPANHKRASLPSLERDGKNEKEDVSSCDGSEGWSETNEPEVIISEYEAASGFNCEQCSETFPDKHSRRVHRRLHVRLRCNKCLKSFQSRSDLKRHLIGVHDNIKDHLCKTCGKTFSHLSTLKQHESLHLGVRPHVCSVCSFAFTDKSHLATHRRIHTGERPYECEQCKKTFARIGYLRTHLQTHGEEKRHRCTICDRSFKMSYHLKTHIGTHTKEKPYSCDECSSSFARRSNVNRHKKKFHPAVTA